MNTPKLLDGIQVLELANILAGPAVGMFLAELGARVIKVENKNTGGDITRQWKLPKEDPDSPYSAYYCNVNWGKEAHLLDLKSPDDRERVYEWVRSSDIVISNFKPQSAKKLGMDYAQLSRVNPQLIFAELTAFGEEDIRSAFDVVLQAETGFLFMTGHPEEAPAKMPVALIDLLAAHQLKEGILCALIRRLKTGQGAKVSTSLIEAGIASLANQATNYLMADYIPQRKGTQHPNIAPYGDLFLSADKQQIVLAVGTNAQFKSLCQVLRLHLDDSYAKNTGRVKHRPALIKILQEEIATWKAEALLTTLHAAQVPAGKVRTMEEVFQLKKAQEMILEGILPNGAKSICVKTVAFHLT